MVPVNGNFTEILSRIHDYLSSGFLYTHSRTSFNTRKTLEASSFLYALIELLDEKGIVKIEELDERKRQVAGRLVKKFEESRVGLLYQEPEEDKYSFSSNGNLDCRSRLSICKAKCCKIPFALSKQDIDERIIRWEFGRPYLIAHDKDGYCAHINRETHMCTSYEKRPAPCRGFDCRNNEKWPVWHDYEKIIINSDFDTQIDESNEKFYTYPG